MHFNAWKSSPQTDVCSLSIFIDGEVSLRDERAHLNSTAGGRASIAFEVG